MSSLFAMTFLWTLSVYAVALLALRFNRDRLPRERSASLGVILLTLALSIVLIAGNIALQPISIGLFAAYVVVVFAVLKLADAKASVLQVVLWLLDQTPWLHQRSIAGRWPTRIIDAIRRLKRQPVVLFVKTDEVRQRHHSCAESADPHAQQARLVRPHVRVDVQARARLLLRARGAHPARPRGRQSHPRVRAAPALLR